MVRALIINAAGGHGGASTGKAFESFRGLVAASFTAAGMEAELSVRRFDDLGPLLYDPELGYGENEGASQFDRLDFVFIFGSGGGSASLPWAPKRLQLFILVKMCLICNKCLFGKGFSIACLLPAFNPARTAHPIARAVLPYSP